jgi:molybdopterin-guanine dinucleotide biosynthesis protein
LDRLGWRGAIVGKHGSGKTTLLAALQNQWTSAGGCGVHYCFLGRTRQRLATDFDELQHAARSGRLLLVDGVERMTRRQRRALFHFSRAGAGLIVTAHRQTLLPTWVHCRTDWRLMQAVLFELLPSPRASTIQQTRSLFQQHRGNVREVLRSLYDRWSAGLVEEPNVDSQSLVSERYLT